MLPNAETIPGEILSPSQANCYLGCSARWRFKYLIGLPDPAGGGAVRGKAVHKAVEYYMRAKIAGVVPDAIALFKGQSVEGYAKESGISINTARWHVKQIYAKTGVKRQSELIQRLLKHHCRSAA